MTISKTKFTIFMWTYFWFFLALLYKNGQASVCKWRKFFLTGVTLINKKFSPSAPIRTEIRGAALITN